MEIDAQQVVPIDIEKVALKIGMLVIELTMKDTQIEVLTQQLAEKDKPDEK